MKRLISASLAPLVILLSLVLAPIATADGDPCGNKVDLGFGTSGSAVITNCIPSETAPPTSTNGAAPTSTVSVIYEDLPACTKDEIPCVSAVDCIFPAVLDNVLSETPPSTNFVLTGQQICIGGPNGPTPPIAGDAAVVAAAAQEAKKVFPFDPPSPTTRPSPKTLVNLPTILTAGGDQHILTHDATLLGVNVTLTATPAFDWSLADLPDIKTSSPGTAYDGTDPAKYPDHYVTATWTTTGIRNISVAVTWTVTLVRHDTNETLTATDPVEKTTPLTVDVRQARSELTGNS